MRGMLDPPRFHPPPVSLWCLAVASGVTVVIARVRSRRRLSESGLTSAEAESAELHGAAELDEALDVEPPPPPRREVDTASSQLTPRRVHLERAEPPEPGEDADDLDLVLAGESGDARDVEPGDPVLPLILLDEEGDADGLDRPWHRPARMPIRDEPPEIRLEDESDPVEG